MTFENGGNNPEFESVDTDNAYTVAPSEGMAGIQTALDNGITNIILGKGTYAGLDGDQINVVSDDVSIIGQGKATVLKFTEATTDSFIKVGETASAKRFELRNVRFDGTNQAKTATGIENAKDSHGVILYDDVNGGLVEDGIIAGNHFENIGSEAICGYGKASPSKGRWMYPKIINNTIVNANLRGIHPHNDSSWDIRGNHIRDCPSTDFDTAIRHGERISKNTIWNVAGKGIMANESADEIEGNIFYEIPSGNTCIQTYNFDKAAIRNNYFFRIDGTTINFATRATVEGNYFFECSNSTIFVDVDGCTISDNTIINHDTYAIRVSASADCDILDNDIRVIDPPSTPSQSIRLTNGCDGTRVIGNRVPLPSELGGQDPLYFEGAVTVKNNSHPYYQSTETLTTGGSPAVRVNGVVSNEDVEALPNVIPTGTPPAANYAWSYYPEWNNANSEWDLVINWETDPGSNMDVIVKSDVESTGSST